MTPQEFKSWFDGFTEGLEGTPSEKQWERIKARVSEIDGTSVTYHRYVDHYWQPYYRYYGPYYGGAGGLGYASNGLAGVGSTGSGSLTLSSTNNFGKVSGQLYEAGYASAQNFNSGHAMYALGKADSESLNG